VLENNIFIVLALFLLGGSLMMLWSRQSVQSAFGFLIAMLAMAGLFALLNNSFLFLAQIMVSVGAVVVISLVVITTINMREEKLPHEPMKLPWIIFSAILIFPVALLLYRAFGTLDVKFAPVKEGFGSLRALGAELFSNWVLPFEIVSVLLLAAMVAAIVIGRKEESR